MMVDNNRQCCDVPIIELGGQDCTCDLPLHVIIRGIQAAAHKARKAVYYNDFVHSQWQKLLGTPFFITKDH